jgi:hypothetical protein
MRVANDEAHGATNHDKKHNVGFSSKQHNYRGSMQGMDIVTYSLSPTASASSMRSDLRWRASQLFPLAMIKRRNQDVIDIDVVAQARRL